MKISLMAVIRKQA